MDQSQGTELSDGDLRTLRDRFVAFSFAATDLVFEADASGSITFVSGAARELTGQGAQDLIGRTWLDLVESKDRAKLARVIGSLKGASRSGPLVVELPQQSGGTISVVFSACRLPNRDGCVYCTMSASHMALTLHGQGEHRDKATGLLDPKGFTEMAQGTLEASRSLGKPVELTLIELGAGNGADSTWDKQKQSEFLSSLGPVLQAHSIGGEGAGRLADDKYGVIHDSRTDGAEIEKEVLELSRAFVPDGSTLAVGSSTLDLEASDLSQEEAGQALVYTINQFAAARDGGVTIKSLKAGFKDLAEETKTKISWLRSTVADHQFEFDLQPIVDLATQKAQHYELLLRLQPDTSPYPWITFAEGVGMIHDLDLAVCGRAIGFLQDCTANPDLAIAINISGQSLSNPIFVDTLLPLLDANRSLSHRLLIEITESSRIRDLNWVNKIVSALDDKGFAVGLDDFGAGAASFEYLRELQVEFVKFDGAYISRLSESKRDRVMLKAMAGMCSALKIRTIAEKVEQEPQAAQLKTLGIGLGQGFLFGRPKKPQAYGIAPPPARPKSTQKASFAKPRFNPFTGAALSTP